MDSLGNERGSMEANIDRSYRSLPILLFYLFLSVAITAHIGRALLKRARSSTVHQAVWQKRRLSTIVFAVLAVLSLFATWFNMFSFFAYSYHDWVCRTGRGNGSGNGIGIEAGRITIDRMEQWLRQTKLFKEAWEAVTETPQRFWWSGQIFLWTTIWSLFLGVMGMHNYLPTPGPFRESQMGLRMRVVPIGLPF